METTTSGARRAIILLGLAIPVLVAALPLAIAPGILQMAAAFGDSTAQFVLTLPAVVMILGAGLCGYLSERWGRRAVIVGALLVYAVSGTLGFFTETLPALVACRAAGGLAAGMLLTTIYAVIGEYFTGDPRERLLGFMSTAASLASVTLLAVMGLVVERFGWRAPFLFYATGLLLVPFALAGLKPGRTVGTALSWRPVLDCWPIYLLLTAYTIGMYMYVIQGPFLLGEKGITAPSTVGWMIALSSLIGAIGGTLYGMLRRWLDFRGMFVLISLTIGAGMLIGAQSQGAALFALSAVILGLGIGVIEPTVASELLSRTPEALHDRAMGANVAAMFLGQFLNPLVVAPLAIAGGVGVAVSAIGLAYLLAGTLFLTVRRAATR